MYPPVAKLDIAVDSDSKGRGFESLRAGQKRERDRKVAFSFSVWRDSNPERVSTVKKQSNGLFLGAKSAAAMPQGRRA